jgi:hypothetical protein
VQQGVPDLTVVQLCGRGIGAVGHATLGIDAEVGVHSEIPVVALDHRRHLGEEQFPKCLRHRIAKAGKRGLRVEHPA